MKFVIIIAIALVLLIPSTVYGATDGYFEADLGKYIFHQPTVCVFQPNDPKITEQRWDIWYDDSKKAIESWRAMLQNSGNENWKITTVEVPLEKLERLNYSACDVTIDFVDKPYLKDGKYANSLGWANAASGTVNIVYSSFEYCGKVYNSEYGINVNSYCFSDDIERSKKMANTLKHELGHIFGLGHYRGYDGSISQKWYDRGTGTPSIMAFVEPNEEWREITQVDIQRVREIYGSGGFGEKIESTIFNDIVIPEKIIEVSGKGMMYVSEDKSATYTISGYVPDKLYKRGEYLEIVIQKPNGLVEYEATTVSKTLNSFNHNLNFNYDDPVGKYEITLRFDGTDFDKKEIKLSKSSTNTTSKTSEKMIEFLRDTDGDGFTDRVDLCPNEYGASKYGRGCSSFQVPPADTDGDGISNVNDKCPTIPSLVNNGCPPSKPPVDSDGDGFPDVKDWCRDDYSLKNNGCPDDNPFVDTEGDGVPDSVDSCPNVKGSKDNNGCPEKTKPETEYNSSQKMKLQNEVMALQQESYEKLNFLKNEIIITRESLEQLSSHSEESKEKINQAWVLLKDSQSDLDGIERRIKGGDNHMGYENYDTAKDFFDNERYVGLIENNLKDISQLIDEIKPQKIEKPQTCFLMWCW